MKDCNPTIIPAEVNMKLRGDEEKLVDRTMYKQMVSSLRYLCNTG